MAQSLSNQNTNAQSMNGLITVNADTITTGSIQTDTIDITNSGTLDVIPTDSSSTTDTRLINAGWVNNRLLSFGGSYVDLISNQTIGGTKTFSNTINGSINGNAATATTATTATSATQIYNTVVLGTDTTTYNVPFATALGANGNASLYQTNGLTYKASTNLLNCVSASTNTLSSVTTTTANTNYLLPFLQTSGSNQAIYVDGNISSNYLRYNPSSKELQAYGIVGQNIIMNGNITANTAVVSNDFNARTITATNNLFNNTTTGAVKIATNLSGAGSVVVGNAATQANNTFYGRTTLPPSTTNVIGNVTSLGLYFPLFVSNLNASGEYTPYTSVNFSYNGQGQVRMSDLLLNGAFFVSNPSLNSYNLRLGDSTCMANATTGSFYNMAFGVGASNALTTATDNISLGNYTLALNQTGFCNVAIGNGALNHITTQGGNIALGYQSNSTNSTGNNTISIGIFTNASVDDSIAIGSSANAPYSGSVAIGLNAITTADNQIQLGTAINTVNCAAITTNTVNCSAITTDTANCSAITTASINSNQTSNDITTNAGLTIYSKLISNTSSFLSASLTTAPSSVCLSADGTRQYFVSGQNIYGGSILQQPSGGTSGITYQAQSTVLTGVWNGKGAISCSYDGRIVLVGRTAGSIYLSFDFGYSYSNITVTGATTSLATSMNSDGKSMIVVNQAGTVFYSNNFGTTWTSGASVSNYPTIISAGYTNSSSLTGDTERYVIISAGNTTPSATFVQLITHTIGGGIFLTLQTSSGAGSKIWTWGAFLNNTCIATSTDGVYITTNTSGNTGWTNPISGTGYIGATIHTNNNPNNLFYLLNSTNLQIWDGTNAPTNSTFGILPTYISGGDRTGRAISFLIGTQNGCILNQPLSNLKSQLLINNNSLNYANLVIPYKNAQILSSPCQLYFPLAENYQILISGALTINLPYVTAANCGVKCWFYSFTARTVVVTYAPFTGNYLQDFNLAPLAINTNLTSNSFAKCFLSSAIISGSNVAYGWVCISNA